MSFEADEDEIRDAVKRGDVEWVLAAFKYKGTEVSKCTCDAIGDGPCPTHARENSLQDELLKLKQQFEDHIDVMRKEGLDIDMDDRLMPVWTGRIHRPGTDGGSNPRITEVWDELTRFGDENTTLRALVATRKCVYGHNQKGEGCELGYPGCACADDLLVFDMERSPKAGKTIQALRKELSDFHDHAIDQGFHLCDGIPGGCPVVNVLKKFNLFGVPHASEESLEEG